MSKYSRWAIGVTALFGVVACLQAVFTAGDFLPDDGKPLLWFAGFLSIVALACFVTSAQPVALRIIGAVIAGWCAADILTSIGNDHFARKAQAFLFIGLPCAYMAILGKYPRWGGYGRAIHRMQQGQGASNPNEAAQPACQQDQPESDLPHATEPPSLSEEHGAGRNQPKTNLEG